VVRLTIHDELGPEPFDESLPRLSDWDLVLRLADVSDPVRLSAVGQAYDTTGTDRISATEPYGPAYHRIRARVIGAPATGLRVLVSAWHFPQVTEAYMQSDIAGLARLGAEVEVWSDEDVAVPYDPGVPWHRGSLEDHIERFRPHLVLTHWLNIGAHTPKRIAGPEPAGVGLVKARPQIIKQEVRIQTLADEQMLVGRLPRALDDISEGVVIPGVGEFTRGVGEVPHVPVPIGPVESDLPAQA
jgi:hypothetical protein